MAAEYTGMVKEMSLCVHFHEAAMASTQGSSGGSQPPSYAPWQSDKIQVNICKYVQ
jgi:hypothetical protein